MEAINKQTLKQRARSYLRSPLSLLLLALVMLALGIYMVISVGVVLAVVGWVMIAAAVVGILDDLMFIRHLDELSR